MEDPRERHQVKVAGYLSARERALALGDRNLARSITVDLRRLGYQEPEVAVPAAMPERATPPRARRARSAA